MDSFLIPARSQQFDLEIKRSKFITSISAVDSKTDAKLFIESVRNLFPDANHHCWAMVAGQPDDVYQQDQSDDGEPKGTAGKPMLNVLQHSGLGKITVVVTRYFGGIKLGAGGLVRAYTQCVSEALKELDTIEFLVTEELKIALPYSLLASLEHWIKDTQIKIKEKTFSDFVVLTMNVPCSAKSDFLDRLSVLGQGAIEVISDKH